MAGDLNLSHQVTALATSMLVMAAPRGLSSALELLRTLPTDLAAVPSPAGRGLLTDTERSRVDTKVARVLGALARAVGEEAAAHTLHAALFAAWRPVREITAPRADDWAPWPSAAPPPLGAAALETAPYLALLARHPVLLTRLCDQLAFETPCDVGVAVAPELLGGIRTGPAALRGSALALALLSALLRGADASRPQCTQCTTAAYHCLQSLTKAADSAATSWADATVARAAVGAASALLAADAGVRMVELDPTAPPLPPAPLPSGRGKTDAADRSYDAAIAAVLGSAVVRPGLRDGGGGAEVDELALAVLALLRGLHTAGLDGGLLSRRLMAGLAAAAKSAGLGWAATAEELVAAMPPPIDPSAGWTLPGNSSGTVVPPEAEFLANILAADQIKQQQKQKVQEYVRPRRATVAASAVGLAAVAEALLAQGVFSLSTVAALSNRPSHPTGLCALATALNIAGIGGGRAVRMAVLVRFCTKSDELCTENDGLCTENGGFCSASSVRVSSRGSS